MSKQDITLYVNENGIIENPTERIVSENVIITIDITPEVRQIIDNNNIKISFCDGFLESNQTLKNLEFIDNARIQIIGNYFLGYNWHHFNRVKCINLTNIDLSKLSNVTQIGDFFLLGCPSLKNIDLSPLSNVTQIGDFFLAGCESLTEINLSPLSNVTQFRNNFLAGCKSLTEINLSPLSNITQIGNYFLAGCSGLTNIDLSPLSKVTQIGHNFLSRCESLKNINLSSLSNVTQIGHEFSYKCISLQKIKILPHQQPIILKYGQNLRQKLEINTEWYNTLEGKIWIENIMQKYNNIQDSDRLLNIIDFL
jgi:hypothetical protein